MRDKILFYAHQLYLYFKFVHIGLNQKRSFIFGYNTLLVIIVIKEKIILNFYFNIKIFPRDLKGDESDLRNRVRSRRSLSVLNAI